MISSSSVTFLSFSITVIASYLCHSGVHGISRGLSEIRYHFTPCGSTGQDGPTYKQCETYYEGSPIATDGVLFQLDEENFEGGQGFRLPRDDLYNVTIAGAAGGRGLCNIYFGLGRRTEFQVRLTTEYELLVMVGQIGGSPCNDFPDDMLCLNPPNDTATAGQCFETWTEIASSKNSSDLIRFTGGGGGGGASMLRAREVETRDLLGDPIIVAGGGGGSSAVLDYVTVAELITNYTFEPEQRSLERRYKYHINARFFYFTDVNSVNALNGTRGFRPLLITDFAVVAGAGGGWSSLLSLSTTDGKSIGVGETFATGGSDCLRALTNNDLFEDVDGGFGGGGGECGGGGGGGGYTGGAVLDVDNNVPGGGGHSYVNVRGPELPIASSLKFSFNDQDGYVDIIPANCNCTGYCVVNNTEDTFECFCVGNTQLAQDGFDCFQHVNASVATLDQLVTNGFLFQELPLSNNSVELFSMKANLIVGDGSVCALVFLNGNKIPVAVSAPLRKSGVAAMLARLSIADNYTDVTLYEYTNQFASSVQTDGAILVSNGSCYLNESFIAMNISTRISQSEDNITDFSEAIPGIAMIARQVLRLPKDMVVTVPPPQPNDITGLVIGLVIAIVTVLLVIATVAAVVIATCRGYRRKKRVNMIMGDQPQTIIVEGDESRPYYAELIVENKEQEHDYNKLETHELKNHHDKRYHILEHKGIPKEIAATSVKDEGYEMLEYEDYEVVRTMTATLAEKTIQPLYGIIAPAHDFTQYNRDRSESGVVEWQYPRSKLIYIRELGEGQFGKVLLMKAQSIAGYKGKIPVAVKTLSSRDPSVISKFMEEADLMKKFSHPNIVSMLGISSESEDDDDEDSAPLMILEYMPYGDLQGFLENHKPDEKGQTCVRENQFNTFACDIALALEFLAENHYVHRDVAARNCLVSTDLHIKLADFGLSREIYEKDYYKIAGKAVLPIRWMAPECLLYGIFTTAADVWSYGVVLWEITSYGESPLDDMEAKDVIEAAQDRTLHHPKPDKCPDYIYDLMTKCHALEASERPNFSEILSALVREQVQYEVPTTNGNYESDTPPDLKD